MTPYEIEEQLPNGFHDSSIEVLTLDLSRGIAEIRLHLSMDGNDADDGQVATRLGVLTLAGMSAMIVDPPLANRAFFREGGVDTQGGFGDFPGEPSRLPDAPVKVWFFVETWDARMLMAAAECDFVWLEHSDSE